MREEIDAVVESKVPFYARGAITRATRVAFAQSIVDRIERELSCRDGS